MRAGSLVWTGRKPPKSSYNRLKIDWDNFRRFLEAKYKHGWAKQCYYYVRKYSYMLDNPVELETFNKWKRSNVMKALIALAKYLGIYEEFKHKLKAYGIKWARSSSIEAFLRMLNGNVTNILEWYRKVTNIVSENEDQYLKFVLLSGLRRTEAIRSFNLIIKLYRRNDLSIYYDEALSCLEHFKFKDIFLRNTKNCYISFTPKTLIDNICNSKPVTYEAIRKKLQRRKIPTRINELRDYWSSFMVRHGLIKEEVDLLQGRVPPDVFIRHYWTPSFKDLKNRTLKAVKQLEQSL